MAEHRDGGREILAALSECRRLFLSCGLFSVAVNLPMLIRPYPSSVTSRASRTSARTGSTLTWTCPTTRGRTSTSPGSSSATLECACA